MKTAAVLTGLAALAAAQRPANESICDYYTTALLKDNTEANQATLLTLIVNTAVIGNYTTPNVGITVPGILNPNATYMGKKVNLLQYFDGALDSTNMGGSSGVSVNFLDGGGAAPLMKNMPADNTSSNQYTLLTHLYEYFGYLLGCSMFANTTMPYAGDTSMYEVHKYMGIGEAQFAYFVQQVGLSAASFGAATADVDAVGKALNDAFGYRCSPPEAIPATASPSLQAICVMNNCPVATASAECSAYPSIPAPATATATGTAMMSTSSAMMTGTGMMSTSSAMMTGTGMMSTSTSMPTSTPPYTAGAAGLPVVSSALVAVVGLVAALL